MVTPELLTVREVAQICRVHEVTIRRHIRQGLLRSVRVGRAVRIRREDLDRYVECATDLSGEKDAAESRLLLVYEDVPGLIRLRGDPEKGERTLFDEMCDFLDGSTRARGTQREGRDAGLPSAPKPLTKDDPIFDWIGSLGEGEPTTVARDIHDAVADAVDKRD